MFNANYFGMQGKETSSFRHILPVFCFSDKTDKFDDEFFINQPTRLLKPTLDIFSDISSPQSTKKTSPTHAVLPSYN